MSVGRVSTRRVKNSPNVFGKTESLVTNVHPLDLARSKASWSEGRFSCRIPCCCTAKYITWRLKIEKSDRADPVILENISPIHFAPCDESTVI